MSIYSEAMEEGLIRGRQASILELLEDYGSVRAELQQKIMTETDIEILKKFHKLASKVNSVEEFEAQFSN